MGGSYRESADQATSNAIVTRLVRPAVILTMVGSLSLGGCSWGANPPKTLTKALEAQDANLSEAQQTTVTAAAREITGDATASVHGLTSRKSSSEPGTHVCGYVKSAAHKSTPLYVELRQNEDAVVAERGQIGATPANLAKVNFMCRKHKNW